MYSIEIADIYVQLTKYVYERFDLYMNWTTYVFFNFPPIGAHVFKTIQIILNYVCIYTKP